MSFLRFVALASFASIALAGCAPPEIEDVGEHTEALGFANDKAAFDFFVAKGLTSFQSAGIVGNLDQESGVNPSSVQYGGGPGRGIAQWSVGGRWDTSSKDNVVWYAGTKGVSPWGLNIQLEFIWYELTTFGYGFSQLKATTNVTDATVVFQDKYEICGTCVSTQRIAYAKQVLAAYGTALPYAAKYVSQSWPLGSEPPFQLKCGESVDANIVLKNVGSKTWNDSTRLGTTQPRDRASIFAGPDWIAPNRAAASGSTAPNANGTFAFQFHGPTGAACVPGVYKEFFGVVQEGAAWFSDNGQGGPPDDQIEADIELVPGDPVTSTDDGGTTGGDDGGSTGGNNNNGGNNGGGSGQTGSEPGPQGGAGCSVAPGGHGTGGLGALFLIMLVAARLRRRDA